MHEPLRMTTIIDAPQDAIESVLRKHEQVRRLVDNGWLHLWRFDKSDLLRYADGKWQTVGLANEVLS